jgi:hypothetical protein
MEKGFFEDDAAEGEFWNNVNDEIKQFNGTVSNTMYFMSRFIELNTKYVLNATDTKPSSFQLQTWPNSVKESNLTNILNNRTLSDFGKAIVNPDSTTEQKEHTLYYYKGVVKLFQELSTLFKDDIYKKYKNLGITIELYIVSTGFAELVRGTELAQYTSDIYGCECVEKKYETFTFYSDLQYVMENESKVQALASISKGVGVIEGMDVNAKSKDGNYRIPYENMLYVGDGPSDIPAYAYMNDKGGHTLAVYSETNKNLALNTDDETPFQKAYKLHENGWADSFAPADYTKGSSAYLTIKQTILDIAERISQETQSNIVKNKVSY